MKNFKAAIVTLIYALSTALGFAVLAPAVVRAHDETSATKTSTAAKAAKPAEKSYSYVAQPGDSYSKIARKAIQTYGIKNKIKLSNAKVIAAETWLTQEAGSPHLDAGQHVDVVEAKVKTVVDKATKLSKTQEAAWNVYTSGVNFNTNAVGQSK